MIESKCLSLILISAVLTSGTCFAQHISDAEVISVWEPSGLLIVKDEAFEMQGLLYVGGFYLSGQSVTVNGTIEIGREVNFQFIDPATGMPVIETYFASIRQVPVSGQFDVPIGINVGGVLVQFSKRVEANPHWIVGKTYICRAKLPAMDGGSGTFTVVAEVGDDIDENTKVTPIQVGN